MLLIQYVYERILSFFIPLSSRLAGAKVITFFYLANVFELFFEKKFKPLLNTKKLRTSTAFPILTDGKDTSFTPYNPNKFLSFFKNYHLSK